MTAASDFGLGEVVRQLAVQGAGGFEWFKESCLLRRVEVRMRSRGVHTLTGYAELLGRDREEVDRLLRSLSVRVTSFFRNPDSWLRLGSLLVERMEGARQLSAWSMGCSTGEEAWSLGMLLLAHAREHRSPDPSAIRVFASDVDRHALEVAEAGRYPKTVASAIRQVLRDTWGEEHDGVFEVAAPLRPMVKFQKEDLTAGLDRRASYDLVTCRNVLIFLGREGQRRVLTSACQALRNGGLVLLGRTESLIAAPDLGLEPLDLTHRIYWKPR